MRAAPKRQSVSANWRPRASMRHSCSLPVSRSKDAWHWCEKAAALLSRTAWSRNQNDGAVSACRHTMPWLGHASLNKWNAPRPKSGCRVPIAAVFSLALSAKAHTRLERGHVLGRIVLQIRSAIAKKPI